MIVQDLERGDSYGLDVKDHVHYGQTNDSRHKIASANNLLRSPNMSNYELNAASHDEKSYERFYFSLCSFHTISSGTYDTPPLWSIAAFQSVEGEKDFRLFKCSDNNVSLALFQVFCATVYIVSQTYIMTVRSPMDKTNCQYFSHVHTTSFHLMF